MKLQKAPYRCYQHLAGQNQKGKLKIWHVYYNGLPVERQTMNKLELANILDELHDANAMLEVCRGYTQSDIPDMKALDVTLWNMVNKYENLYKRLCEV